MFFGLAFVPAGSALAAETELAGTLFEEGKWKRAAAAYALVAEAYPSVEHFNLMGEALLYNGKLSAAEKAFASAAALKENPETKIMLAAVRAMRHKARLRDLEALGEVEGKNAFLLKALGLAYLEHDRLRKALEHFTMSAALEPDDYILYFYIGLIHERAHQFDLAIPAYKEAIRLRPRFAEALNNLGYVYKERRYYSYAIEMYERAIEVWPERAGFHYNAGNAYSHRNMLKEAFYAYVQTVELDPTFAKAHYNLGRTMVRMDMMFEALEEFKLYVEHWDSSLDPKDTPSPRAVKDEIAELEMILKKEGRSKQEAGK